MPKIASTEPQATAVMIAGWMISFSRDHTDLPRASRRSFSRRQARLAAPGISRSTNFQMLSPMREEAGSSGVATSLWWPLLCSMKKCP